MEERDPYSGEPTSPPEGAPPAESAPEHAQPGQSEGVDPERDPAAVDEDAGPAVEPTQGDQGEQVAVDPGSIGGAGAAAGFDPSRPVATSAAPPDSQSGVPDIPGGANEGVEPPSEE